MQPSGRNPGLVLAHRLQLRSRLLADGEQPRETVALMDTALLPIVEYNARSSGTDSVGYLSESPGFSTFVRDDDTVYQAYSTTWRGLEFLMGYHPILDHAPKGRDEGEAWQLWIRRHDEYDDPVPGPIEITTFGDRAPEEPHVELRAR